MMSRGFILLIVFATLGVISCDTPKNVEPRNEDFFIKFHAGVNPGDQFASDIISTSDGGLLIIGTSENNDGTKELILIKTDIRGNQEWIYGALQDFGGVDSEGKSVIEVSTGGYVVGGSVGSGGSKKSVIIRVSETGGVDEIVYVNTNEGGVNYPNVLSKITLGSSGILVSGQTTAPANSNLGNNGFIRLFDEVTLDSLLLPGKAKFVQYLGTSGEDSVVGAYEVSDLNNIGSQNVRYLVFGTTDNGTDGDMNFFYTGFNDLFEEIPGIGRTTIIEKDNLQIGHYLTRYNDTYWMIGESILNSKQIMMVGWRFAPSTETGNDWNVIPGTQIEINTTESVAGKGLAIQGDNKYVLVGDRIFGAEHSEIYLARVTGSRDVSSPWPKEFGTTTSQYTASAVTTLADGSIVVVGTADLQPIKKIIVIKTGPDGQMSF